MKAVQKEREEKLARLLRDFLNQYVQGDKRGFLHRAESEAKRLSGAGLLSNYFLSMLSFPLQASI